MSTSTLFADVPADIAALRMRLFLVKEEVIMPREQWDAVWPYVDNIWVKNKTRPSKDGSTIKYFLCRKHASESYVSKVEPGSRKRQRAAQDPLGCGMRIKTVTNASYVTATRTGEWQSHCHELELLDHQKKNSGIMKLAAREASRGYKISVVAETVTAKHRPSERAILKDLGGHWLTLVDVHNSAAAHKAATAIDMASHPNSRRCRGRSSPEEQASQALEPPQAQGDDKTGEEGLRRARKPLTKEQWLAKKAAEWDRREERRKQQAEDARLRSGQGLPPEGSWKRKQGITGGDDASCSSSDEDEEDFADAPFEWDDVIAIE
ncbi:hypothetical protein MMC26_007017 [Xylographa opegraphella]|nr:hypothetical protein [Xylographa opegraphella]